MRLSFDGSVGSHRRLVWALQEAARREATVLAVVVLDADADEDRRVVARALLHAQLRTAVEATGVRGRGETALLEPSVFRALTAAARGTDFVVVGPHGKTMLRPAVPRPRRAFPRSC